MARYKYKISKVESNKTQKSAFKSNTLLLKPREDVNYQKLQYISGNRIQLIKNWIDLYSNYEELIMTLNSILENLSFGQPSDNFEKALQDLGVALGFLSQRPDREFKKDQIIFGVQKANSILFLSVKVKLKIHEKK
ncbi:hypothetical protein NIES2101_09125 [Calothrix sp. HK-06]|nr:hypothetical protein NIES2101_09125 [Calothrix sp. HK-06]